MKTPTQKGFTLTELLVAVFVGSIVILAATSVLASGQTFWNQAWKHVSFQRDGSYAMLRITRPIRAGKNAELDSSGTSIKIYREIDWIRFFFDPEAKQLKCEVQNQQIYTVIENVLDLKFTKNDCRIGIDLKLEEDNLQMHCSTMIMMRNYGE